jgi:hypothetical protein
MIIFKLIRCHITYAVEEGPLNKLGMSQWRTSVIRWLNIVKQKFISCWLMMPNYSLKIHHQCLVWLHFKTHFSPQSEWPRLHFRYRQKFFFYRHFQKPHSLGCSGYPSVKWPEHEAGRFHLHSDKVKNAWTFTATPLRGVDLWHEIYPLRYTVWGSRIDLGTFWISYR